MVWRPYFRQDGDVRGEITFTLILKYYIRHITGSCICLTSNESIPMKLSTKFTLQPNWKMFLNDLGVNVDDVLRLAGLPQDLFQRQDIELTPAQYFNFWTNVEGLAGMENLPLKIGQIISVEMFDPALFACVCSPNLNVALQRLSDFKKLIGPMHLQVNVLSDRTVLDIQFYEVTTTIPKSLAMTELVFFTQLARLCTRSHTVPLRVYLPELPENPNIYHDFFGVRPQKSDRIRIEFSKQDALQPFLTANPVMWSFFEPNLRKSLAQLENNASFNERVKAILLESLPAGLTSIDDVADRLAMSKRTLQRMLEEEQTNFKTILDETRQALAQHYLKQPSISAAEISFLLGFQETNSFTRAFKSWTGQTPNAYRHQHHALR